VPRNLKISLLLAWCVLLPAVLWAVNTTIYRVPSTSGTGAATYQSDLDTFLRSEDAGRLAELPLFPQGVIAQGGGGVHGLAASMTSPPFVTIAYTSAGNRVAQASASINYAMQGCAASSTAWVIASSHTTTPIGSFMRVPGMPYYTDCSTGGSTPPTLPSDSTYLMKVTLSGGQITAVQDLGIHNILAALGSGGGSGGGTALPTQDACLAGSAVEVSDAGDVLIDATAGGVVVLDANPQRCQALIQNTGAASMRCGPATVVVSAVVGFLVKAGETLTLGAEGKELWRCIRTTSTSTTVSIAEAITP
jgi:hypothetical protein